MTMTKSQKYSTIRWHLTEAIRNLEMLYIRSKTENRPELYVNEYDYWLSSLDLLRNCLYGCKYEYDGQIGLDYSIIELKTEVTNFIKVVKKVEPWELAYLDKVWHHLKEIEEILV